MSEFQYSLLIIGLIVVSGVYGYGLWQQWRYRRSLGTRTATSSRPVFAAPAADLDALLDGESDTLFEEDGAANKAASCELIGERTDYVATFTLPAPLPPTVLATMWERRFDFDKSVHACGLSHPDGEWERMVPDSRKTYRAFRIALQLVDRSGSVRESRLGEFCMMLSDIAEQLKLEMPLPSVLEAMDKALELDKFCAEVDQMIGINLAGTSGRQWFGTEIAAAADRVGLTLQADGAFHLLDNRGASLFSLRAEGVPFQHHNLNQTRVDLLTLLLDIPCVPNPVQHFDEMMELAAELSRLLRATLADDQRAALGGPAIARIRAQVAAVEQRMQQGKIPAGSAQAIRLFS